MAQLHDVILRPLVTEKGERMQALENTYVFEVGYNANKHQVKAAVEELFGVTVTGVHTVRMRGKIKRFGRYHGKRNNWKKAYVALADGDTLDFFQAT
jgi:large subunit ribosomal protein L23